MTDVTCAIIRDDEEKILIVQRGEESDHPFKWEFPGGKCNDGESWEDCILREIREELEMDIVICSRLDPVEYDYGTKQIRLIPFVCDSLNSRPELKEHIAYRWVVAGDLPEVDFQEADILVADQYVVLTEKEVKREAEAGSGSKDGDVQVSFNEQELIDFINMLMSMKEADWLAENALSNPAVFGRLLDYSFSADDKLAFRASWVLTKVCDKNPEILKPHLCDIVKKLPDIRNDSVIRSFMRILSFEDMKIFSEEEHGILADFCLSALNSPASPVAVKAYAMEILYRLTIVYPQLGNEVASSIRSLMEEGSPGIISKGKSVLRRISSITSDSLSRE